MRVGSAAKTFWATVAAAAIVAGGVVVGGSAGIANADPVTSPVPAGLYLQSPWVKPGDRAWVAFVGASGCDSVDAAAFVGTSGTTPVPMEGFGDGYWESRGYTIPSSLAAQSGALQLTCAASGGSPAHTVSLPLQVSPTQPATIYHSATAWTWYTPGSVGVGAKVRINALGFAPGESVVVSILNAAAFTGDLAQASATPVAVTADGEGAVTAEVTLPGGWTDTSSLSVLASGVTSRYLLSSDEGEPINGQASVRLAAPGAAVPGGSVSVTAGGFVAGETVAIALHSAAARAVQVGTLTAGGDGVVSGRITIPAGVTPGSYRIWAGAKAISYLLLNDPVTIATSARISASDRFSNSVEIARAAFPGGASVVYVATGLNYPDALGAGAAAASAGGPLLLTTPGQLPPSVKDYLAGLTPAPTDIIVVGGPNSVSPAVVAELKTVVPGASITRQGGADRYEASRNIVSGAFEHSANVFIATGATFPDALSATSAAASLGAPVVLVPGTSASVDQPTLALLNDLGVTDVTITGGPNSVSPAIETQLKTLYGAAHVTRLGGADRFEASSTINKRFFAAAGEAYLATGSNFPDALAGGVLAANHSAPLLVVHGDCVPDTTLDALQSWGVTKVTLIGGPASLTAGVGTLQPCA